MPDTEDSPDPKLELPAAELMVLRSLALRLLNHTCTRASDNFALQVKHIKRYTSEPPPPYFCATSSLVYTSGYCVFWKYCSSISSWSVVKVVRARRTFRRSVSPGSVSTSDSSLVSPPAQ